MVVYVYTFPNGKKYVGQTIQSLEQRAAKGKGYSNQLVGKAIEKYGWSNIQKEIFECKTEEEMDSLEQELIALYKTTEREFGYNIDEGGKKDHHLSEEHKKKIGIAHKRENLSEENILNYQRANRGENHPLYGKHHSEETKKKMSKSHMGKLHTEEEKRKIGEANKSKIPWHAKKVICLNTGEIFDSIGTAAKAIGIKNPICIYKACVGINKTSGGLHWKYLEDYEAEKKKESLN